MPDLKPYLDPSGVISYREELPPFRDLLAECRLYLLNDGGTTWTIRKGAPLGRILGLFGGPHGRDQALKAYPDAVLVDEKEGESA